MEEKILLPRAQEARGGELLAIASKLKQDHGSPAALFAPRPTPAIRATLQAIVIADNALEEGADELYPTCDALLGEKTEQLVVRLRSAPVVKLAPFNERPRIMETTREALARAGYHVTRTLD